MNERLLNQIVEYAEEEPRRFNMASFYDYTPNYDRRSLSDHLTTCGVITELDRGDMPPCGSVCCIAGAACILTGAAPVITQERIDGHTVLHYRQPNEGWMDTAQEKLDLTKLQAERLFFPTPGFLPSSCYDRDQRCWPEPFRTDYINAKTPEDRVAVLKRRVAAFIRSKGKV